MALARLGRMDDLSRQRAAGANVSWTNSVYYGVSGDGASLEMAEVVRDIRSSDFLGVADAS